MKNYNIDLTFVAREMHPPPSPGREDAFHELSTSKIHPPPPFQFDKFNGILIIRKMKNWISNIYLPKILNLQPRTVGNKRKYKEIESDGSNESPQREKKNSKDERK